ncbi:type 2 isopentenyl-diphosphate Delta-isomerase [Microbacterium marinilacus]|uniref:Isopentenyl-diphosphate delta-isomerase n=1 Tax=Microbacterium marinilacus TaxID=415209 RepID=A0ABP7BG81_9MICO|nr:type 2 isopentenyl-diphosphate Delta-isomerase [Microbacterium marinilacus]MBY0688882.1 type 2 isopentenyl-diphosphate Delta-isomerase [Microbacterium marinilacus]
MDSETVTAGTRAARKDDHLRLAVTQQREPAARNDFDDVEIVHHALDGIDVGDVDLATRVGDRTWPVPLYINAMTGGTANAERVNRALAIAARETGAPIASGSLSLALDDPWTAQSFRVIRDENPRGVVLANLGADRGPEDAARAVDLLEADALQIHLNAVQETIMREGSRDFGSWAGRIERIVAASPVPVIVKEVGFGLSRRTLRRLSGLGVRVADVSGTGGTSFARIEDARRGGYAFFDGYGQSAACCLLDAPGDGPALLASGGVRSPLDVVRSLALGARAAGVAGPFLAVAVDGGADAVVEDVRAWISQTAELLALLGTPTPAAAAGVDLLLRGRVREFCELRGIDPGAFSRRGDGTPAAAVAPIRKGRTA